MGSSTASRLLNFSNNASLKTLINRHLLRPSIATTSTSITQILNPTPEPKFSVNPFNTYTYNPQKYSCNPAEMFKKTNPFDIGGFPLPCRMMGFSGFGQSWILMAPLDSDGSFVDDSDDDADTAGDFGYDDDDAFNNDSDSD